MFAKGDAHVAMMIFGVVGFLWFLMPLIMYGSINLGNITGMIVFVALFIYGYRSKDIRFKLKNNKLVECASDNELKEKLNNYLSNQETKESLKILERENKEAKTLDEN